MPSHIELRHFCRTSPYHRGATRTDVGVALCQPSHYLRVRPGDAGKGWSRRSRGLHRSHFGQQEISRSHRGDVVSSLAREISPRTGEFTGPHGLEFSPAHIHMNILPPLQRQGWGRKMMGKVVEHLQEVDPKMEGLWIGVDPRNEEGKKFYKKLGATHFPTEHGEHYILRFSAFK